MAMASRGEMWTDSVVREALAREIAGRLAWMNRLRLLAGSGLLAGALALTTWMPDLPGGPLAALGGVVLAVDAVHALVLRRLARSQDLPALRRLVRLEFWIDWGLLLVLMHFTGGTQSPLLPFFVFHAILAAVLLERRPGLSQCVLAFGLVVLLAISEHSGFNGPEPPALLGILPDSSLGHTATRLVFFGSSLFLSFFLTHAIAGPLWQRTWDRLAAQQRRQMAISRLHGLQRVSETLAQDLSLERVLQGLVQAVMESQRAHAASLRLRDGETGALRLAASAGRLPNPVGEEMIDPAHSPIDRAVLQGQTVVVAPDSSTGGLFAPLAAAGIGSMVGIPLAHRGEVLGVLRVFFDRPVAVSPEDLSLLQAVAEAGASAIRNASAFEDLQRLEQVKSRYVFHLAHQLKSPLSAVRSALSLLEEGFEGSLSAGFQDQLRKVRVHAAALQALVNNLMALGALRDPSVRQPPERVDLAEAAAQAIAASRQEAVDRGLSIGLEVPDSFCVGFVSPEDLQAILTQVLDNAVKYSSPGGRIRVQVRCDDAAGVILVRDEGIGIPPEEQGSLFQEFFRATNARAHAPGTGLGLVLARRLAERNRGTVEVRSPDPDSGTGTLVIIRIPQHPSQEV